MLGDKSPRVFSKLCLFCLLSLMPWPILMDKLNDCPPKKITSTSFYERPLLGRLTAASPWNANLSLGTVNLGTTAANGPLLAVLNVLELEKIKTLVMHLRDFWLVTNFIKEIVFSWPLKLQYGTHDSVRLFLRGAGTHITQHVRTHAAHPLAFRKKKRVCVDFWHGHWRRSHVSTAHAHGSWGQMCVR